MYKVSVPINLNTVTEENLPFHLSQILACKADRVFLGGLGHIYTSQSKLYTQREWVQKVVKYFQSHGLEVGFWVSAFGHGAILAHDKKHLGEDRYTPITGIRGETSDHALCPLDENFRADYAGAIRKIAELRPDIIMLDDDFRFNLRKAFYQTGCFCPLHLKKYYEILGEEVPREKIEEKIFTGGKNKYRSAYMRLMGDSLLDFARMLREVVNGVEPAIRLGCCVTCESWDYSGTDPISIAKAFAGNTKPFTRIAGAPYWNSNIVLILELTRQEYAWTAGEDVEIFSEGDTYPRPRYNVPSKTLELFDFTLLADGTTGGMLHYLFDYSQKPEYETGYARRFIRNAPIREAIREMFDGKTAVGVREYNVQHKLENWEFPLTVVPNTPAYLQNALARPASSGLLAANSIPTAFTPGEYPILIFGENARYVTEDQLKHGAILDADAARILQSRGIDAGLLESEPAVFDKEFYISEEDAIGNIGKKGLRRIRCHPKAEILSHFLPEETPAVYRYENEAGQRFFVMAFHFYTVDAAFNANYFGNYYRQAQLVESIPWLCGKKLPAVTLKNPNLYVLTKKDENAMAVSLSNVHLDDVIEPEIRLDKAYRTIRFLNCTGKLEGDRVILDYIPPYGFAAFEVRL